MTRLIKALRAWRQQQAEWVREWALIQQECARQRECGD